MYFYISRTRVITKAAFGLEKPHIMIIISLEQLSVPEGATAELGRDF